MLSHKHCTGLVLQHMANHCRMKQNADNIDDTMLIIADRPPSVTYTLPSDDVKWCSVENSPCTHTQNFSSVLSVTRMVAVVSGSHKWLDSAGQWQNSYITYHTTKSQCYIKYSTTIFTQVIHSCSFKITILQNGTAHLTNDKLFKKTGKITWLKLDYRVPGSLLDHSRVVIQGHVKWVAGRLASKLWHPPTDVHHIHVWCNHACGKSIVHDANATRSQNHCTIKIWNNDTQLLAIDCSPWLVGHVNTFSLYRICNTVCSVQYNFSIHTASYNAHSKYCKTVKNLMGILTA